MERVKGNPRSKVTGLCLQLSNEDWAGPTDGIVATIDDAAVIDQILAHLEMRGARDGPEPTSAGSPRGTTSSRFPSPPSSHVVRPTTRAPSARIHPGAMLHCPFLSGRFGLTSPAHSGRIAPTMPDASSALCQAGEELGDD
jgi:hypothetical protein